MSGSEPGSRVLVALSGGIDSFVAAALLRNQGYEVQGAHVEMGLRPEGFRARCCRASLEEKTSYRAMLERACARIGIELLLIPAEDRFEAEVIDSFVHGILDLRLPHPCLDCTHRVRFETLFQTMKAKEFDYLATGHYAQVTHDLSGGPSRLSRAIDRGKDQSHWLFQLPQEKLQRLLLPLGGIPQSMVRKLAEEFGLRNQEDVSETVCVIGNSDESEYRAFTQGRVAPALRATGLVRSMDGTVVGEHEGFHNYSIGQTRNVPARSGDSLAVLGAEPAHNLLVVGEASLLYRKQLLAARAVWVRPLDGLRGTRCAVRLAGRPGVPAEELPCRLTLFENDMVGVDLGEQARFLPPGQPLVFYAGDEVLGGAYVERPPAIE